MANELTTLDSSILAELAKEAKEAAARERPALGKISLKGGIMSYAGSAVAGNAIDGVIIGAVFRNTFYASRFDAKNIVNPNCFALGENDEAMSPHENVAAPENATCKGCPRSAWGTDLNGGNGKACKQTRRLVILPSTALDGGAEGIKTAELAILDVPVTSVKNYSSFVNGLNVTIKLPTYAVVTHIALVPDPKTQIKVTFNAVRAVDTLEVLTALKSRRDDALRVALTPYDETAGADPDPAAATAPTKQNRKF